MGKWSTYRRRGAPGEPAEPPDRRPRPPTLRVAGEGLEQDATGLDDIGGLVSIFTSVDAGETWQLNSQDDWSRYYYWGPASGFAGFWVRTTETGNDIDYVGESLPSNELHFQKSSSR